ncbi:zinc dependent phospholipase C family protein [Terrimonas rubra]|uniref:Zinc dependent phospholipase C family protein n=1 Tax=Terrimonas rubra TaxID=1035890 RepID=A0ABW5ZYN0_9BACT
MKKIILLWGLCCYYNQVHSWGFFGHRLINEYAVFLLPADMLVLFKPQISFLKEHAVDPDKRRYAITAEAPRHYIDIDHYGVYPYDSLPRGWQQAVQKYGEDSLQQYGIVPWWVQTMLGRLTQAFKDKNQARVLKYAAELGHYIADAHVPLHATKNHNGQYTGQKGIHGFWESCVPELFAEKNWDFFIGKADYIHNPGQFIWARVLESAAAVDTVLRFEKELSLEFPADQKYAFEERNGVVIKQYSTAYTTAYDACMKGMVERRMRQSIYAVASFWYTAWVNAGQPDLKALTNKTFTADDLAAFEALNNAWLNRSVTPREHE